MLREGREPKKEERERGSKGRIVDFNLAELNEGVLLGLDAETGQLLKRIV